VVSLVRTVAVAPVPALVNHRTESTVNPP
jgi:hypothetical protein